MRFNVELESAELVSTTLFVPVVEPLNVKRFDDAFLLSVWKVVVKFPVALKVLNPLSNIVLATHWITLDATLSVPPLVSVTTPASVASEVVIVPLMLVIDILVVAPDV